MSGMVNTQLYFKPPFSALQNSPPPYLRTGKSGESLIDSFPLTGEESTGISHKRIIRVYLNGDTYHGPLEAGEPHGFGLMRFSNGDVYEGQWKRGEPCGLGLLRYFGGDFYRGGVKRGVPHGGGFMRFSDGTCYRGGWGLNKFHGQGTIRYLGGKKYKGNWYEGWPGSHLQNPYIFEVKNNKRTIEILKKFPRKTPDKNAVIFQSLEDKNGAFAPLEKNAQLLSSVLSKAGFKVHVCYFSEPSEIEKVIKNLDKTDLVWFRAHGKSSSSFLCSGSKYGDLSTFLPLAEKLNNFAQIVFESCRLGIPGGLGQRFSDHLTEKGIPVKIISMNGIAYYRGFDFEKLYKEGKADCLFLDDEGKNICQVYGCD